MSAGERGGYRPVGTCLQSPPPILAPDKHCGWGWRRGGLAERGREANAHALCPRESEGGTTLSFPEMLAGPQCVAAPADRGVGGRRCGGHKPLFPHASPCWQVAHAPCLSTFCPHEPSFPWPHSPAESALFPPQLSISCPHLTVCIRDRITGAIRRDFLQSLKNQPHIPG